MLPNFGKLSHTRSWHVKDQARKSGWILHDNNLVNTVYPVNLPLIFDFRICGLTKTSIINKKKIIKIKKNKRRKGKKRKRKKGGKKTENKTPQSGSPFN